MAKSRTVLNSPASMRRRQPSGVLPIKFQGPRTEDHGPRTLGLRPSDQGPRIVRLGPWFLERGPRLGYPFM
jgi:hypothetical protein